MQEAQVFLYSEAFLQNRYIIIKDRFIEWSYCLRTCSTVSSRNYNRQKPLAFLSRIGQRRDPLIVSSVGTSFCFLSYAHICRRNQSRRTKRYVNCYSGEKPKCTSWLQSNQKFGQKTCQCDVIKFKLPVFCRAELSEYSYHVEEQTVLAKYSSRVPVCEQRRREEEIKRE